MPSKLALMAIAAAMLTAAPAYAETNTAVSGGTATMSDTSTGTDSQKGQQTQDSDPGVQTRGALQMTSDLSMSNLDGNRDGSITREEFETKIIAQSNVGEQNTYPLFEALDGNDDGSVTAEELDGYSKAHTSHAE